MALTGRRAKRALVPFGQLIRQSRAGAWTQILERVGRELEAWAAAPAD